MNTRAVIWTALILGMTLTAWADGPLVSDRPDFTESTVSVGPGRFQLEGGATWAEGAAERDFSAGEVLLRAGLSDRVELRLEVGSLSWTDGPGDEDPSGYGGASLGFKVELVRASSQVLGGVQLAVLAAATLPIGDADLESDAVLPSGVLAAGWDLTDRVSVGSNLGLASFDDGEGRFTAAWLTGVVGLALSERWGTFFELFGFSSERDRGPRTGTLQLGATFLITDDLQVDARFARRVTSEGLDALFGFGAAWRFGGGR